ncbi:hypothetical protein NM208_g9122 [Fusarium decemcellulare]|uniref:Uncharacterized protein n=1 Tax=Fusarium decemcellulare TaxID=57161 RepID=A0ACC1S2Q2_9HYPO|nr:hypothetical protein NM208_g9122 [Fusarium decemcellulare]
MIPKTFVKALVLAGLSTAKSILLEDTPVLPDGWEQVDQTVDPDHTLRLSIAMRQPDIDNLKTRLRSRDASSGEFTQRHLSQKDAMALREPDQADVDEVLAWLKSKGMAAKATPDKDWIHVKTTIESAEDLLDMKIGFYQFENQDPVLRTREYSVPESVADAISFIHPIANFMRPKKELTSPVEEFTESLLEFLHLDKRDAAAPACNPVVSPDCLYKLYNIKPPAQNGTGNATSSIRLGIAGFLEQYANYQDSDKFLETLAKPLYQAGYNYSVELINGGENSQDLSKSGNEAALDVQYAMALAYPANIIYYLAGGRGPALDDDGEELPDEYNDNEPYLEFLDYLLDLSDDEIPHVLSISYADNEVSVPRKYAERVCSLFGLLTARGTSVLSASGDGGAKGSSNSTCHTNDGTNQDVAMAVFPATCPWVTSIGGVTNAKSPPVGAEFSGGGFSQYFLREKWQDASVKSYVKALDGHLDGYYNASYRAVPDISAVASNFITRIKDKPTALRGTSASTPVIASMIALINDARVRKGKDVLGWLNEVLYSEEVRAVLQDVTEGESFSCNFQTGGSPGGWPAAKGYDAITGLGVPYDFEKLFNVLVDI